MEIPLLSSSGKHFHLLLHLCSTLKGYNSTTSRSLSCETSARVRGAAADVVARSEAGRRWLKLCWCGQRFHRVVIETLLFEKLCLTQWFTLISCRTLLFGERLSERSSTFSKFTTKWVMLLQMWSCWMLKSLKQSEKEEERWWPQRSLTHSDTPSDTCMKEPQSFRLN